ncbi:MAG: xanthine dehydrogenase family protein molybdopterin-binding subunit [Acidobacteriota bacterium]
MNHPAPSWIGQSVLRRDVAGKVNGETRYGGDLKGPEVLSVAVIRSPHPHAEIRSIDTRAARRAPGVLEVLGADDLGGVNLHGLIHRDQPVFCDSRARYLGDALGIVVAETPAQAAAATLLVEVDYRPLPILATMDDALAEGAPAIHPAGNIMSTQLIRKGNADAAIATADAIVQTRLKTQCVDHAFLDIEAGYARLVDDVVEIHASGQWVHEERRLIALSLGLPVEKVRLIQPPTGGAFGGREDISIQIYLGLAALRFGRPVRIQYTREESMVARHKRHPMEVEYTLAARADGTLTAARVTIRCDEGAYASTGPAVLRKAASHATGPYRVPNVHVDAIAVFTNNNPTGAMRGFGACQMGIAYENALAALARRLDMDLVDLKRKNLIRDGDAVTTSQIIPVASPIHCLEAAAERLDWENRSYDQPAPHLRRGYGISAICFGVGYGDSYPDASRARVRLLAGGGAEVFSGGVEVGQGLHNLMAQIVAEELGLTPDEVAVTASDTAETPESGSSSATRQTVFTGNAVKLAAGEVRRQLLDVAAAELHLHWEELKVEDGWVMAVADGGPRITLADLVTTAHRRGYDLDMTSVYQPRTVKPDPDTGLSPRAFMTYMFASHAAEVVVDLETGEVVVERLIAVHDVGKAINPREVAGQIEGGAAQGLGMALMEEVITDQGEIKNASFTDYLIPTIADVPWIESIILERPDLEGPYGARGVGEPPLIGTVPAVLGAISDAIGAPISETPATAERVWSAIHRRA